MDPVSLIPVMAVTGMLVFLFMAMVRSMAVGAHDVQTKPAPKPKLMSERDAQRFAVDLVRRQDRLRRFKDTT